MWSTLLSLIPQVVSMFSSSSAEDDYQKSLDKMRANQRVSQSSMQAKSLLAENATRGLPGYETMREDIENRLPVTINENRDWLSSGAAVDFLVKAKSQTDQQLRALAAQNAQAKQNNMNMYSQFLGTNMANQEDQVLQNQTYIDMAKAQTAANQAGTMNKIGAGLFNTVGNTMDLDWRKLIAGLSGDDGSGITYNMPVTSQAFTSLLNPANKQYTPDF